MLFCTIPFGSSTLAEIFRILNRKKEEKLIETYSLTQTTLEQLFVELAGEDEKQNQKESSTINVTRL